MLLDHVVVAVPDLDAAVDRLRRDTGLAAAGGGPQPEWGTANRIVPLGSGFLEFMAVALGPGNPHAAAAPHAVTPDGFAWVEVGGDAEALREWLGPDALPVRPVRGASGPVRVAIATDAGEVVVPPGSGSR